MQLSFPTFTLVSNKILVDFENEISNIQDQGTMYSSRLFEFLLPEIQQQIREYDGDSAFQEKILRDAYKVENSENLAHLEQTIFSPEKMTKQFQHIIRVSKNIEKALKDKHIGDFNQITNQKGISTLVRLTMYFVAQRFHEIFNVPQFLWSFVKCQDHTTPNLDNIANQLILSRLNFILNGVYLPVIAVYSGDNHATTTLFIPFVSDDGDDGDDRKTAGGDDGDDRKTAGGYDKTDDKTDDKTNNKTDDKTDDNADDNTDVNTDDKTSLEWFVVFINSNGSEKFQHRTSCDYIMQQFEKFVKSQNHKSFTYTYGMCDENIQGNFGTCVSWSFFLTLYLLSKKEFFYEKFRAGGDFVYHFCHYLSLRNRNTTTIDKFNEFISDLYASFYFLTLDFLKKNFDFRLFISALQTDIPNSKMLILCDRIFEASGGAMDYMNKHIDRMPPSVDELQIQMDKIDYEIINTTDASKKQILKDRYSELQESRDKLRYHDDFEIETDEETEQDRILRQQRKLSRSYDFGRKSERKRTPVSVIYRTPPRQMTKRRKPKTPAPAPLFSPQKRLKKTPAPVVVQQRRPTKTPAPAPVVVQQRRPTKTPAPLFSPQKRLKKTPAPVVVQQRRSKKTPAPAPLFSPQKRLKKTPAPVVVQQRRSTKTPAPAPAPIFSPQKRSSKTPAPIFSPQKRSTPRSRGKSR
jgi:hypothetical protein